MNYLLSFVVLCFLLSGCAAVGIQVGKSDNSESFKADQVPQTLERGPRDVPARLATSNHSSKSVKALSSGPTHPDQF
jgi:hypothetical protein